MAVAKRLFVDAELSWAEKQLEQWKEYVDTHPLAGLKDREGQKITQRGGVIPYVIANIETQGKFIQDTMKNYLALLKEVDNMRSMEEDKKIKARGVENLSPMEDGRL